MVVFIDKVQHFWPSQNNINKLSWGRQNGVLSSLIGEKVITLRRGNDAYLLIDVCPFHFRIIYLFKFLYYKDDKCEYIYIYICSCT